VGSAWPDPTAVRVEAVAVPDLEAVEGRAHTELAATSDAHREELAARLGQLGAARVDADQWDFPEAVPADPQGSVFCVLKPREMRGSTGPIAALVVGCADLRAMARFWGEAMDWILHEVDDDHALLHSAEGVDPYVSRVPPHAPPDEHAAPRPSRPGALPVWC
jgi:hypothetical protein